MGHINAIYLDWNSCKDLKQFIEANGFKHLLKDPTRVTDTLSTLTDIILLNNEKNIVKTLQSVI